MPKDMKLERGHNMASKFTKFLTFTAVLGAAAAAGAAVYKKYKEDKSFVDDDFDDFDDLDDFEDDFDDLDSENRGYTSITPDSEPEKDAAPEGDFSDALTKEEKDALATATKDLSSEKDDLDV